MRKIRKLYYFDKKNTQEMISFLNNSANETYINRIMFNPFITLHHFLPLRFKFLPESFILKDKKEIKGLITVAPSKCPFQKIEIQKLLFEENCFEAAEELIHYVVSKYKAMGAISFIVKIDDYLPELIRLFVSKCGFSQISYEKLWRIKRVEKPDFHSVKFRAFRNSDALAVASLYNDSLLPHFRPLLKKEKKEFDEFMFKGLSYYSEYKYIIEEFETQKILGCISIQTSDNENYVLDIVQSLGADIDLKEIIFFANKQIHKRKNHFGLFIKTKKYTQLGNSYEQALKNDAYECVQNQVVLTNSSAKIIEEKASSGRFTVLNQFYGGRVSGCS